MLIRFMVSLSVCFTIILGFTTTASAIALGQIDDFQDGTTQNWTAGLNSLIPHVNSPDNGPLGIGDHALLLGTTGAAGGPSSKLTAFNFSQWTGDYTGAGVHSIELEANNLSGRAVNLRLAADGAGGQFSTISSFLLPANSGYQSITFDIAKVDWTTVGGADIAATLAAMSELRLIDSLLPSFTSTTSAAGELLVDNILAVPEPGTITLAALLGIACVLDPRWLRAGV